MKIVDKVGAVKAVLNRMRTKRKSIKKESDFASRHGLKWRKPVGIDASLTLIEAIIPYIEIWAYRRNYALFELAMFNIKKLWPVVCKHVVDANGVSLEGVKEQDVSIELIVDAMGVFCKGLLDEKLPGVYLDYTAGSPTQGFYNLMSAIIEFEEYLVKNKIKETDIFNHALGQSYIRAFANGIRDSAGPDEWVDK